jgi:hypothetical protein
VTSFEGPRRSENSDCLDQPAWGISWAIIPWLWVITGQSGGTIQLPLFQS